MKKKILIHSNFCRAFTGFGKNKKNIMRYLFDTGKYELMELANGLQWGDEATETVPWKCRGSLPPPNELTGLSAEEQRAQSYDHPQGLLDASAIPQKRRRGARRSASGVEKDVGQQEMFGLRRGQHDMPVSAKHALVQIVPRTSRQMESLQRKAIRVLVPSF